MRLALLSDVHANLEALRAVLDDAARQGVDRIVSLGDVVGYNADPGACLELLAAAGALGVAGNHDLAVAGRIGVEGFTPAAIRGVAWTRARLTTAQLDALDRLPLQACLGGAGLVAVHGALRPDGAGCALTRLDAEEPLAACFSALAGHPSGARLCAFGHTHRPGVFAMGEDGGRIRALPGDEVGIEDGWRYLVNPGTVGQPRSEERRATYMVLDTGRRMLRLRRVGYDAAAALAKTRAAGGLLPPHRRIPAPLRAAFRHGLRALGLSGAALRAVEARERRRLGPQRRAGDPAP